MEFGVSAAPFCDCRHVPAIEDTAGDLTTDPDTYFRSLDEASQDRIFTKSGAQAIRDGANPAQVVNARAGMSTAQVQLRAPGDRWTAKGRLEAQRVYGRDVFTTTEGTTRRGSAYRAMRENTRWGRNEDLKLPGERYARSRAPRLMPESVYAIAEDRADAIRLLRINGYITD